MCYRGRAGRHCGAGGARLTAQPSRGRATDRLGTRGDPGPRELAAVFLRLDPEHVARLETASGIDLGFPHEFINGARDTSFVLGDTIGRILLTVTELRVVLTVPDFDATPSKAVPASRTARGAACENLSMPDRAQRDDGWASPDSLEGPVAAPGSHHVLLETPAARVLEVIIDPGGREPEHTHRHPSLMIVDQPGANPLLRPRPADIPVTRAAGRERRSAGLVDGARRSAQRREHRHAPIPRLPRRVRGALMTEHRSQARMLASRASGPGRGTLIAAGANASHDPISLQLHSVAELAFELVSPRLTTLGSRSATSAGGGPYRHSR